MTQLAIVKASLDETSGPHRYLTFTLGGETFALAIERIREVIELAGMTRMPMAPKTVPGVINLRGVVIPVIDLAHRFGRGATRAARRTCVIVVELPCDGQLTPFGLIVDAVSEAIEVEPREMEARPMFGTGLAPEFVAGMLKRQGKFVVVLELASVLALDELESLVTNHAASLARRRAEIPS